MTVSSDLSEIAESVLSQAREENRAGRAKTRSDFWGSVLLILVFLAASTATQVILQRQTEERLRTPQPAVVDVTMTKPAEPDVLCPGEILHYALMIEIEEPTTGTAIVNVKNLDTNRIEIATETPRIDEVTGTIKVQTNWMLPLILPATPTRPAREWSAGNYRRSIAITNDEGDRESDIESVDFIVPADCPGVRPG